MVTDRDAMERSIGKIAVGKWNDQSRAALTGYMARAVGLGRFGIEIRRQQGDLALIQTREAKSPERYSYVDRYSTSRPQNAIPKRLPEMAGIGTSWDYVLRLDPPLQTIPLRDVMSGTTVPLTISQYLHIPGEEKLEHLAGPFLLELKFYWNAERMLAFEGRVLSLDGTMVFADLVTQHDDWCR